MRPDTSEWTTTPPGTPGVYWAYYGDEVLLVRVSETNGGTEPLIAVELGDDRERSLSKYTHWLGPLSVPDAPDR